MPSSGRAAAVVSASRCRPRPRTVERPCFHLSIPAIDLQCSHDWYVGTLGCRPGRRSDQAAILDFEGLDSGTNTANDVLRFSQTSSTAADILATAEQADGGILLTAGDGQILLENIELADLSSTVNIEVV